MQFNARASYLLGLAYLKRSRFAEAETLFARTIEADPYGDLAALASFKMGSSAYAQQQYGKAADAFHEAGERAGRTPLGADALYNRALSLEKKQDFAAARDAYQHFASEYPEHDDVTRALFKVGYCSQELGDNEAALEAYRRVLAYADPELAAEVQFWMGECYAAMGRGEDAAREFLKVAYLYPDVGEWAPTAEFRAGMHYQEMGRDDEARAIFQRLVDRYGKSRWGELARQRLDAMQAGG
jgi:TolA-binding protein